MDFNDATALMRLVQAVENDPYVSSGAGEALADKVREFIEDEAELGGWYTELMNAIGEGEPTFRECGTFTDHGFGFHAQDGTRTAVGPSSPAVTTLRAMSWRTTIFPKIT